jgi:hypothetical protein
MLKVPDEIVKAPVDVVLAVRVTVPVPLIVVVAKPVELTL